MGAPSPATPILPLASAFYLLLASAAVIWLGLRQGEIGLALFVEPSAWGLHLAAGMAVGGGLAGSWALARRALPAAQRLEERLGQLLGPLAPSEALALALLSGFAEELFFRGAVLAAWGWVPATVLFALLHAGPGLRLWMVFAALAGAVLAALTLWSGTLLAAVSAHATVNAVGLLRLARQGDGDASRRAALW